VKAVCGIKTFSIISAFPDKAKEIKTAGLRVAAYNTP